MKDPRVSLDLQRFLLWTFNCLYFRELSLFSLYTMVPWYHGSTNAGVPEVTKRPGKLVNDQNVVSMSAINCLVVPLYCCWQYIAEHNHKNNIIVGHLGDQIAPMAAHKQY